MKTPKNFKMIYSIAVFLFSLAFVFYMSSCGKQEPLKLNSKLALTTDEARQIGTTDASDNVTDLKPVLHAEVAPAILQKNHSPFEMIKIQHFATRFNAAEWNVKINSSGLVTFEGKRNCALHGNISFNIDPRSLALISALYTQSHFFMIDDMQKVDAKLPVYSTTCFDKIKDTSLGKTLGDFDDGYPPALVNFRTKVISLLNISKYIGSEIKALPVIAAKS